MNQNYCPSIHLLFSQATAQGVHMIHSLEIPACYYAPRHDHPDHPIPARTKKVQELRYKEKVLYSNKLGKLLS